MSWLRSFGRHPAKLAALGVVLLAVWVVGRIEVVLDISAFMLEGGATPEIRLSKAIASSELTRTLIVLIEAPTTEQAVVASRAFESALKSDPEATDRLEALEGGPRAGFEEALWRLYEPRTLAFAATSSSAAQAAVSVRGFADALDRLVARLRSPMSTLVARVAPNDPLLVFPRLFDRLSASQQGGLRLVGDRFVSKDGRRGVVFLRTKASAFNGGAQAPLLEAIDRAFARMATPDNRLQVGGLHRFAVRIERSIKSDITRVTVLSAVGLIALFLVMFRSLRVVGLTLCILSVGLICGLAASLAAFGRVHGLTLAFGASMIGVSIDYSVHFFVHHTLAPSGRLPTQTLRRLWPGLSLGAATTVAGFAGLAGAGLPGLREVAVFAASGIVGALLATGLFLPRLVGRSPTAGWARPAAAGLTSMIRGLEGTSRARLWFFPAAALTIAVAGVPMARWDDDVASLTHLDPELVAEEEAVRAQVAPFEQRRFVVAQGATLDEALAVNERLAQQLARAVAAEELTGYRSLAPFLPSSGRQQAVARAVQAGVDAERLRAVAAQKGFRPEAFDGFFARVAGSPPAPLTSNELMATPLEGLLRSFVVSLGERYAVLTYLVGVRASDALAARVRREPGAMWFDQSTLYRDANRRYRQRTVVGLSVGFAVVLLLVAARYRRAGPIMAAVGPAGLAVGVTIATLGVLGLPLNIVALTALLMVFSMGVDYGVFLAEAERMDADELGATLLSVAIAWASTLLGFGLLALSSHPAMRTIGVTASIGVTGSMLLAPTALILARRRGSDS